VETETRLHEVRVRYASRRKMQATVDRIQVQQVLVNLLRNACEAMTSIPPGQRQVTIAARPLAGAVEVSVEDAGEGIPPENLHRVFDAFFTSKPGGVGIGLSISRSIVESHGGRLWVEPNAGQGVTFRFTLPRSGVKNEPDADGIDRR
jgi:signal transduction histidine kinase